MFVQTGTWLRDDQLLEVEVVLFSDDFAFYCLEDFDITAFDFFSFFSLRERRWGWMI